MAILLKQLHADLIYKDKMVQKYLRNYDQCTDDKGKQTLLKKANQWADKVELLANKIKEI